MYLDPQDIKAATAPINQAKSMPAGFYTEPDFFALERKHVLLKNWFFTCREDQLAKPGDYRAFDTVGGPVMLIRGEDGVLRAFVNWLTGGGASATKKSVTGASVAPAYHAWSYFSDNADRVPNALSLNASARLRPLELFKTSGESMSKFSILV